MLLRIDDILSGIKNKEHAKEVSRPMVGFMRPTSSDLTLTHTLLFTSISHAHRRRRAATSSRKAVASKCFNKF